MDCILAQGSTLLTEVGIGGVLTLMILKTVLPYVSQRKKLNGSNGGSVIGAVGRDEFERHKASVQYKDVCIATVQRVEEKIDKFDTSLSAHLTQVQELVKNGKK